MIPLAQLLEGVAIRDHRGSLEVPVKGIHYHSKRVEPGFVFVAIPGLRTDGHLFVDEAVARGAVAVVVSREVEVPLSVVAVEVEDTRLALARMAAALYSHPSLELRVVGVTGTNGKTTTTHLIKKILEKNYRVGLVGTLGFWVGTEGIPLVHTTPESLEFQEILRKTVTWGGTYAVCEVSSHALDLNRVEAVEFDAGVFTNLTQDHLDYHGDMQHYLDCKAKLFAGLGEGEKSGPKYAVLNSDDPASRYIASMTHVPTWHFGLGRGADVRGEEVRFHDRGITFRVRTPHGDSPIELKLVGMFNVYNALASLSVGLNEGMSLKDCAEALAQVVGIPGRFESVDCGQPFKVIVDYAHTPDGLENVLRAARAITSGRVITVFGCGGDRDRGKRPLMGEVAARLSDIAVITSDNPRSEDPQAIISEIIPGVKKVGGGRYFVEPDRRRAIELAIREASAGDLVLIAGKGHENYQIIGDRAFPFSDQEVAREVLGRL